MSTGDVWVVETSGWLS